MRVFGVPVVPLVALFAVGVVFAQPARRLSPAASGTTSASG